MNRHGFVKIEVPFYSILLKLILKEIHSLQDIRLFDVYTGEKIDSYLKSLALSLILQDSYHTLTDQEVEKAAAEIVSALATELGAKLRD